ADSAGEVSRQAMTTRAPAVVSASVACRPRPELAPVMTTVRPVWSGMSAAVHLLMWAAYGRPGPPWYRSLPDRGVRVDAVRPGVRRGGRVDPLRESRLELLVVLGEPRILHVHPCQDHLHRVRAVVVRRDHRAVPLDERGRLRRPRIDTGALGGGEVGVQRVALGLDALPVVLGQLRGALLRLLPLWAVAPALLGLRLPVLVPVGAEDLGAVLGGQRGVHGVRLLQAVYCGDHLLQVGYAVEQQLALPGQVGVLVDVGVVE